MKNKRINETKIFLQSVHTPIYRPEWKKVSATITKCNFFETAGSLTLFNITCLRVKHVQISIYTPTQTHIYANNKA